MDILNLTLREYLDGGYRLIDIIYNMTVTDIIVFTVFIVVMLIFVIVILLLEWEWRKFKNG